MYLHFHTCSYVAIFLNAPKNLISATFFFAGAEGCYYIENYAADKDLKKLGHQTVLKPLTAPGLQGLRFSKCWLTGWYGIECWLNGSLYMYTCIYIYIHTEYIYICIYIEYTYMNISRYIQRFIHVVYWTFFIQCGKPYHPTDRRWRQWLIDMYAGWHEDILTVFLFWIFLLLLCVFQGLFRIPL